MVGAAFEIRCGPIAHRAALSAAAVALAWLGGCAPVVNAANPAVAGTVTLGPQCGGPQREGQSCDIDYEAVEVRLVNAQGATVASVRTDANGRFSLAAPAGSYALRVMSPKVVRCPEHPVVLPLGQSAPLLVACDSGRR